MFNRRKKEKDTNTIDVIGNKEFTPDLWQKVLECEIDYIIKYKIIKNGFFINRYFLIIYKSYSKHIDFELGYDRDFNFNKNLPISLNIKNLLENHYEYLSDELITILFNYCNKHKEEIYDYYKKKKKIHNELKKLSN